MDAYAARKAAAAGSDEAGRLRAQYCRAGVRCRALSAVLGRPTNVGQVTSIRTLEKQIRRLRVSEYGEVRELGLEIAQACAEPPECAWDAAQRAAGADAGAACGAGRVPAAVAGRSGSCGRTQNLASRRSLRARAGGSDRSRTTPSPRLRRRCCIRSADRPSGPFMKRCGRGARAQSGSARCGAAIAGRARRSAARISRRPVLFRHADRYRRLSRYAPAPALPSVPAGLFGTRTVTMCPQR